MVLPLLEIVLDLGMRLAGLRSLEARIRPERYYRAISRSFKSQLETLRWLVDVLLDEVVGSDYSS
jgi:hypothetical protein